MKSLKERVAEREERKEAAQKAAEDNGTAQPKTGDGGGGGNDEAEDYNTWTVAELRDELAKRELPTSGNKADLVAALEENDNG
jgi:hypothetical protein